jgi:thiol-disulfide isomerase/thioredoxin
MKINSSSRFSHLYFSVVLFFSLIMSTATYGNNFLSFTFDSFSEIKSKFKDQEFLLGLWSVDCPPCLVELNMMGELLELNPDLPFVLISTDSIDTKEDAIEFLADFNLEQRESWMFADNFVERLRYTIDPNWYGELPRSYFFDKDHNMQSHSGIMTRELLQDWFVRTIIFP